MKQIMIYLFFVLCAVVSSCKKEAEDPTITLNVTSIDVPYTGGSYIIYLDSNSDWHIASKECTIDGSLSSLYPVDITPNSGSGSGRISIDVDKNNLAKEIKEVITFRAMSDDYIKSKEVELSIILRGNPNAGNDDNPFDDDLNGDDGVDDNPSDGGSGNDSSGGNDDNNNNGNDDNDGINSKPSAPVSVTVDNYGPLTSPDIRVTWEKVAGATSYKVYRSLSATGYYSLRANTQETYYRDNNCDLGKTYYYKVKAYNGFGESEYSDYVEFNFKDTRKPGPVVYGSCYVGATSMTLRWSVPTHETYGKPTKALLRVKHPDTGSYVTINELDGSATSVSFNHLPYVDSEGYVFAGIVLENENGSGGGVPKVYDYNDKKWIN